MEKVGYLFVLQRKLDCLTVCQWISKSRVHFSCHRNEEKKNMKSIHGICAVAISYQSPHIF